jgi:hypothetical protein
MGAITVTTPTVTDNRHRTEVRHSIVAARTSKFEVPLIKSSERYVALAREASTSGDRVAAENLYQHAEHYLRIMNAANEGHQHRATRPDAPADAETEMAEEEGSEMAGPVHTSPSDRQPYSA